MPSKYIYHAIDPWQFVCGSSRRVGLGIHSQPGPSATATVLEAVVPAGGAAGQHTDLADEIAVTAGTLLSFRFVNNAGGASAQVGAFSFVLEGG